MPDDADAFRYDGRVLCELCGMSERDEIVDASGHPLICWEGCDDEKAWPQRAGVPAGTLCAECGEPVDGP